MSWHQVYLFISFFTIGNKLLLFLLFFFQRSNKRFNKLLAFIIGSAIPLMITNLLNYLQETEYISLMFVGNAGSMLYYPLCVLFFHESLKIPLKTGWKFQVYMWGPVAYYLLLMIVFLFMLDAPARLHYIEDIISYRWESRLALITMTPIYFLFLAHSVYFLIFIRKAHYLTVGFGKDHLIRRRYRFVRTFVVLLIGLSITMAIFGLFDLSNQVIDMLLVPVFSNILTLLIVYFAFDGRLVQEESSSFQLVEHRKGATLKPEKGVVPKTKRKELKQEIDNFFEENTAFCDSDFSLQKMAELMKVPAHQLSFVINAEHGQSFSELLGYYRIRRAKSMIESDAFEQLTIEGIGQMVGYKSKSTFFNQFKKNTGYTPLYFKRRITENSTGVSGAE